MAPEILLAAMPKFMWDGIFTNLNVLVPALILALFNARYQYRWKKEFQIMGDIASLRIDAYERLLAVLGEVTTLKTPTMEEARRANDILSNFQFRTFNLDYPSMFASESAFDEFYDRLLVVANECQLYLDYEVSTMLQKSIAIFTHFKFILDAFSDTERYEGFHLGREKASRHVNWAYQLCGMAMYSDCTRAYVQLEQEICNQLNHFKLNYGHHNTIRCWRYMQDAFAKAIMFATSWNRDASRRATSFLVKIMSRERRLMTEDMKDFYYVLQYVHFSDKYRPGPFFDGSVVPPEEETMRFSAVYASQKHYM